MGHSKNRIAQPLLFEGSQCTKEQTLGKQLGKRRLAKEGSARQEFARQGLARQGLAKESIGGAVLEVLEARQLYSTVAVNLTDVHQTIAGLGGDYAIGAITGPYTGGVAQDSVGELTLQYLSPTEARVGLPLAQWAPTNDNGQGSPTWAGYQDNGLVHNVFTLLQQLQSKGIQITLTTWNIPDWMCANPSASQQREIAPGMDQAYANAVASFVARAQSMYGVKISYFSVNEADGGYNVSLTSSQEASLITTVGAQFQAYGVGTKWLVGDTFDVSDAVPYVSAILQDSSVLPFVGGISYHTWWSGSLPASSYAAISTLAQQYDLPVFVTEVGVGPTGAPATNTWDFAADLSQMYFNILGPGQANAALDWEFQNDMPVASTSGQAYPVFYVLQQMANTLTPGTQVVGATSDDSSLLPLAVVDPKTGNLSVQVQNTNAVDEQVTLTGLTAGTYTMICTSATQQEANEGTYTVDANGTALVTLPAESFTTFTMNKPWAVGSGGGTGGGTGTGGSGATPAQLQATPSANTSGSWNDLGNTYANAFDGDTNTFFDAPTAYGNWVQLDFGSAVTLTQIAFAPRRGFQSRMIGGVFETSNDPTFSTGVVTLYTIAQTPPAGLNTVSVNAGGAYRYLRYVAPAGSYGNIAELDGLGIGGTPSPNAPLTGVPSANTSASFDGNGDVFTNAFDGNVHTFFDAPSANGDWIQLDLGTPATITQITFAPRAGFQKRMVGGFFEASDDPTFSTNVFTLYTITQAPSDGLNVAPVDDDGPFRYVRYVAPNGSHGDIAEMQLAGQT